MTEKYKNKYRIPSSRLQHWDYGWNASYFITICTHNHEHYFGGIVDGEMILSDIGKIAWRFWSEISNHFPFVILNAFVVMPNHVHGIIIIDKTDDECNNGHIGGHHVETRQCLVSTINNPDPNPTPKNQMPAKTIGQTRFQNQGQNNLSSIIGSYKSVLLNIFGKFTPLLNGNPGFTIILYAMINHT